MLYTLFSPAEGKQPGGRPMPDNEPVFGTSLRDEILQTYNAIVTSDNTEAILNLAGLKKSADIEAYRQDISSSPCMPAVERYNGVAYEYLDVQSLPQNARAYLNDHLLIFSNLYGVIRAGDGIINYKVKQGNAVGDIAPDRYYATRLKAPLDELLEGCDILDLRAGYYDKFYKCSTPYTTLKFIKNGKVVSHWAKAYRGLVLRQIALEGIDSLDAFMKMEIQGLQVNAIKESRNKREIIYDIIE